MRLEIAVDEKSQSRLIRKLEQLPDDVTAPVRRAVASSAMLLHGEAVKMLAKPGRGRTYKRRGVEHQASRPGDPPAADTGIGRASVAWRISANGLVAVVGTNVGYMSFHEQRRGTQKRPWLAPSLRRAGRRIIRAITKAVDGALKRTGH